MTARENSKQFRQKLIGFLLGVREFSAERKYSDISKEFIKRFKEENDTTYLKIKTFINNRQKSSINK